MTEDERPEDDHGHDELIAAFAALCGGLAGDELRRLVGCGESDRSVVQLAALLLGGDTGAAEEVARNSLAALQDAWDRLGGDPDRALAYLRQAVVYKARSVGRPETIGGDDTPAAPDPSGAGYAAAAGADREPWVWALRGLPARQREAVVLHYCLGVSAMEAAAVMGVSAGAAKSHLVRGMSALRRPPGPE